jgi:hypothetical protein
MGHNDLVANGFVVNSGLVVRNGLKAVGII